MQEERRSLQGFFDYLTSHLKGLRKDLYRIYQASKGTALLLLLVEVYLGLVFVLEIGIVAGLVDALIGAQAIGVVTSDVTKYFWMQIALFISLLPVLAAQHYFEGLVAKLGNRIRRITFVASTSFIALPVSALFIVFLVVFSFVESYVEKINFTLIFSVSVIVAVSLLAKTLLTTSVHAQLSVGQTFYWLAALLALSGYLSLRPYLQNDKS